MGVEGVWKGPRCVSYSCHEDGGGEQGASLFYWRILFILHGLAFQGQEHK